MNLFFPTNSGNAIKIYTKSSNPDEKSIKIPVLILFFNTSSLKDSIIPLAKDLEPMTLLYTLAKIPSFGL